MRWLYKNGMWNPDGSFTIDAEKARRWLLLASTDYFALDEQTKEWDRIEARQRLAVIEDADETAHWRKITQEADERNRRNPAEAERDAYKAALEKIAKCDCHAADTAKEALR